MITHLVKKVALVLSAVVLFLTVSSLNAATVGEWTFDTLVGGTTIEDQVASNDLLVSNSVSLIPSTAGPGFGNAGLFGDTNNDSLNSIEGLAGNESYVFGTSAFSYTGWVNIVDQQTSGTGDELYRYVVENARHNYGGVNLFIGPTNKSFRGKFGFDIKGAGADNLTVFSDLRLDDSNWHWFAAVSDGSTMTLYVDGILQAASASYGTFTTANPDSGRIFKVGKALDGSIDQLAVHNAALTGTLSGSFLTGGELYDLWQEGYVQADADFDADGDIDGVDFLAWQRGFGINSGATLAQGDANGDGAVNADDLVAWEEQFGNVAAAVVATTVPEPTGVLLFVFGSLLLSSRKSRSNR